MFRRRPNNLLHCLLRVRHTRAWPAFTVRQQNPLPAPHADGAIKIDVQHYADDSAVAIARSKLIWRLQPDPPVPGHLGNTFVSLHGKGGSFPLTNFGTRARPGETDIIASGWSDEDVAWMPDTLRSTVHATAVCLGIQLDDLIVSVAQPYEFVAGARPKNTKSFHISVRRAVADPFVAANYATALALNSQLNGAKSGALRSRAFARAAERLMKAIAEPDPVDRYLEYWLAVEIMASRGSTRDVLIGLKSILPAHLRLSTRRGGNDIEAALRLKDLKQVRNDIVHGNRDDVDPADLALLQAIANELIRAELGLKYQPNPAIDSALAAFDQPTRRRNSRR